MTEVNPLLNSTSAGQLAQKLDALDGEIDGKISKSIWNEFVKDKNGKTVKEFITNEDAMKSITTYVIREAKKLGLNVEGLIQVWQPIDSSPAPSPNPTNEGDDSSQSAPSTPKPAPEVPQAPRLDNSQQIEADLNKIKVTIPTILKDAPKIQQTFDKANEFLVEVVNKNPKPTIRKGEGDDGKWKEVTLLDKRWIKVYYDNNNQITHILISHDTTPADYKNDGSTGDAVEVQYTKDEALYNIDHTEKVFEGSIKTGYNFNELVKIAEAIFGKS